MNKDLNSGGDNKLIRKLKSVSKDLKFMIPNNQFEKHK